MLLKKKKKKENSLGTAHLPQLHTFSSLKQSLASYDGFAKVKFSHTAITNSKLMQRCSTVSQKSISWESSIKCWFSRQWQSDKDKLTDAVFFHFSIFKNVFKDIKKTNKKNRSAGKIWKYVTTTCCQLSAALFLLLFALLNKQFSKILQATVLS